MMRKPKPDFVVDQTVRKSKYACQCCGKDRLGPQVHDPLWRQMQAVLYLRNPSYPRPVRFLCITCMEFLIERSLVREDLQKVPLNGFFGRWIDPA